MKEERQPRGAADERHRQGEEDEPPARTFVTTPSVMSRIIPRR